MTSRRPPRWAQRAAPRLAPALSRALPSGLVERLTGQSKAALLEHVASQARRERGAPQVGHEAPDFELPLLGLDGAPEAHTLRLSSLRGRPVVLFFGSYTCPVFRSRAAELEQLHARHRDEARFLYVYGAEAHPTDGWAVPVNAREGIEYRRPTTLDERAHLADLARGRFGFTMPVVLDGIDDATDRTYGGMPVRLYLLDADGRVRYRGDTGPAGFDPDELAAALDRHLTRTTG